jgi:2-polyprenyl-6-hydroxyphenyl methylase / 3-demethylubiquinone-9 3-methyltransferase
VDAWWEPDGVFAMLHALAAARARRIPAPRREGALLVDLGCGGGLLAPHVQALGYRHVGIDLTCSALAVAARHGVTPVAGDVTQLPLPDAVADVVTLGEILEHVADHEKTVAEACRILRPGGALVIDTIANTRLARVLVVEVAERIPGAAPKGIHDPRLFVDRQALIDTCAAHGVPITLQGLRPTLSTVLGVWRGRKPAMQVIPFPLTSVLFQGFGTKER